MAFDVKEKVEEVVAKIQKDPALLAQFKSDPVKALETVLGVDLPDEQMNLVVAAVKAKMGSGDASDLAGIAGKLGDLFKK